MTIVPDGVSGGGITEGATWFGEATAGALFETMAAMFKAEVPEEADVEVDGPVEELLVEAE
jgi:hypothetical protein